MQPVSQSAYSFQGVEEIPAFDTARILLVMDGHCAICSGAARRIARWDQDDRVRITTLETELGRALMRHYGFDPADPASWLMIEDGRAYGSLDAIVRLGLTLRPGVFWPLQALKLLPLGIQDWLYARLARNRYALFGRDDLCALPDAALRQRLIG